MGLWAILSITATVPCDEKSHDVTLSFCCFPGFLGNCNARSGPYFKACGSLGNG